MQERQTEKRRFKKRYIVAILLIVGLVALGSFRRQGRRQLEQRIVTLRAQGYPMTLAEVNDGYIDSLPDGVENGWPLYAKAFLEYVEWNSQAYENLPGSGEGTEYRRGASWAPFHLQEVDALLADNEACLRQLYEAAGSEFARIPLGFSPGPGIEVPNLMGASHCARLLRLAGQRAVRQNDSEAAAKAIEAILSLANALDAPLLICQLLRTLVIQQAMQTMADCLSLHALSQTQIASLEARIVHRPINERYRRALIVERCPTLDAFTASREDKDQETETDVDNSAPVPSTALNSLRKFLGLHDRYMLAYLTFTQDNIEATALPHPEVTARLQEIEAASRNKSGMMARRYFPRFQRMHQRQAQTEVEWLCAVTALAVERYRLEKGGLPGTLRELVPDFLKSVPQDPFDGQHLRFRRRDSGYVVYSIGQDLADNQGEEKTTGKARRTQKEWDETFIVER